MTKDDVLRMAREAGMPMAWISVSGVLKWSDLERFAKLVYEKAWADTALAATHTVTDAAILKEREACARVCEDSIDLEPYPTLTEIAAAIRARNQDDSR